MKLVKTDQPGVYHLYCPGCECEHAVYTQFRNSLNAIWSWNGSMDRPTFNPSLLVKWTGSVNHVCHSFIRDGRIQFLNDCTHKLAGQTVELRDES
jgi:hypothetical protein